MSGDPVWDKPRGQGSELQPQEFWVFRSSWAKQSFYHQPFDLRASMMIPAPTGPEVPGSGVGVPDHPRCRSFQELCSFVFVGLPARNFPIELEVQGTGAYG